MGREVRRVPPDWKHPMGEQRFRPLFGRDFATADQEWSAGYAHWQEGFCRNYGPGDDWIPHDGGTYSDWDGPRPNPDDFMPQWSEEEATHFMMYESTSEGTPISPAFATPEE